MTADTEDERSTVKDASDTSMTDSQAAGGAKRPRPRVRRRTVLTILAAILAVGLLVVLPAVLSARPGFFGRYPELAETYESWSTSPHAEVGCEQCHVAPKALARTAFRVYMVGQVYLSPVKRTAPDVFESPKNDACLECHNDLRSVSPEGDLQIPHRAHVTILEMDCVDCHNYLVHKESPSGGHVPEMEGCLTCHDGDRAKDSCWACHTDKAAPATHKATDWLVVHPDDASDEACAKCHEWSGDWCVQCHETRPKSHGTDWRAAHGVAVKTHRSCEACHAGESCIECHGVVPQLNLDANLKLVE